jgi:DNA-directed RNA polymerase specialized sigma24 family protein
MAEALRSLVEAARRGDRQALNALAGCADRFVRIFSGTLSSRLRQTCGSTVDFVLEGLAEALARLPGFEYRSDEQFYGWVADYIRGRIIDAGRREGREGRHGEDAKQAGMPVFPGGRIEDMESPDPSPSSVTFVDEVRHAVGTAIVELQVERPLEMEVVVLKVFEDRTWSGIRDLLDLTSEKRARTLFASGIASLRPVVRKLLGKDSFEEFLQA